MAISIYEFGWGSAAVASHVYIVAFLLQVYMTYFHTGEKTLLPFHLPWELIIPAILLTRVAPIQYHYYHGKRVHKCRDVPTLSAWDLLGVMFLPRALKSAKGNTIYEDYEKKFARFGDNYFEQSPSGLFMHTIDASVIKQIQTVDFDMWRVEGWRREMPARIISPQAIIGISGGDEWRLRRGELRPTFKRNLVTDLSRFEGHVERFIASVPQDKPFDMQGMLYGMTMGVAIHFVLGREIVCDDAGRDHFSSAFDELATKAPIMFYQGLYGKWKLGADVKRSHTAVTSFIQEIISEAKSRKSDPTRSYVFMDALLESGLDEDIMEAHLLSLIHAGRGTTAHTIGLIFWALTRNRDVLDKLLAKIDTLNGQVPTADQIRGMKYLHMVITESLRLLPSVGINARTVNRDTTLNTEGSAPVFIPKGTTVRWSAYSVHRRAKIYGDDADVFRPERWADLPTPEVLTTACNFIPFSSGYRICPGKQLAMSQIEFFVIRMLQTFPHIAPKAGSPERPELKLGLSMSVNGGCWFVADGRKEKTVTFTS